MSEARRAIFRTDASVAMGGGHLRRCLVLADALAEAGWEIVFACSSAARAVVPGWEQRAVALLEAATFDDAVRAAVPPVGDCTLLVIDDYRLDARFERACRPWAGRILAVDDLANRRHDCDVIVDPSPGRRREDYAALVPADCELLLGPAYALLDPRFREARRRRRLVGKVERVFVNFGATDPANATALALDALERARLGAAIDVALGAAAPQVAALGARIAGGAVPATLRLGVDDMAALMLGADIAIGAGGGGALERCALGLPSLILTIAENQVANAAALAAAGAALYLGDAAALSADDIAAALEKLSADQAGRRAMSVAAARLVDGLGAARVRASCYTPPRAKNGRDVTLRPAGLEDAPMMLAWQSAPGIRAYARNPASPGRGEHERWLRAKLDDPDCIFNIVQCGSEPVGVLRFDRLPKEDALEVSILIAAERQGLGIGGCALALAEHLLPRARIVAVIHPDNRASIRMFKRAGYRENGPDRWVLGGS